MPTLSGPIDIVCAEPAGPFRCPEVTVSASILGRFGPRCSRFAAHELVCDLAGLQSGLYRDTDGVWWTGDWSLRLATPDQTNRWRLLNEVAQLLGFEL